MAFSLLIQEKFIYQNGIKKILLKFATLLERDRLELALLDTIDMGKTINDTFNADLPTSIDNIEWYAEIIDKLCSRIKCH